MKNPNSFSDKVEKRWKSYSDNREYDRQFQLILFSDILIGKAKRICFLFTKDLEL